MLHRLIPLITIAALVGSFPSWAEPFTVRGQLRAASGGVPEGARVELVPMWRGFTWGREVLAGRPDAPSVASAAVDDAGRFQLEAPEAGLWLVVARASGFLTMQSAPLALVEPKELPALELQPDGGALLEVRTPGGEPCSGASAYARSKSGQLWQGAASAGWTPRPRFGLTSEDGLLTLPRAVGEELHVQVVAEGFLKASTTVRTGTRFPVALVAGAQRGIEVRDGSGQPRPEVLLHVGDSVLPTAVTDSDGRALVTVPASEKTQLRLMTSQGQRLDVTVKPEGVENPLIVTLPEPGRLTGRVIEARTRKPLAGALVWAGHDPGAFVRADAEGRYELMAFAVPELWILAQMPGHLQQRHRLGLGEGSPRALTLALERAAALAGQVVDAEGQPLTGAQVYAARRTALSRPDVRVNPSLASAGSEGRFRLRGLVPGEKYELWVQKAGFATATVTAVAIDAARRPPPLSIVLTRGRVVLGRVLDERGNPVARAEVSAEGPGRRPLFPAELMSSLTDEDGLFEISSVATDRAVRLRVDKTGFVPLRAQALEFPEGEASLDLGELVLKDGFAVHGRVSGPNGRPLEQAEIVRLDDPRVVSAAAEGRQIRRLAPDVRTDPDGSFVLEGLLAGRKVDLLVRRLGFLQRLVLGVDVPTREPLSVTLPKAATLAGRLVDEEGHAIAKGRVTLRCEGPLAASKPSLRFMGGFSASAASDRKGRFVLRDVALGKARIEILAEGFLPAQRELEIPSGEEPEEVTLVLARGATLRGRVLDSRANPVARARIRVRDATAHSDADGFYRLAGVPTGAQTVAADHRQFARISQDVEVEDGVNVVDLTFEAGREVAVRVVDPKDLGIAGARVDLVAGGRSLLRYTTLSESDGGALFPSVARGEYTVRVEAQGYAAAELKDGLRVVAEPPRELEVRLEPGRVISGRLLGLELDEMAAVEVTASSEGEWLYQGQVDSFAGRYEIRDLAAGDWEIRAALRDGAREALGRALLQKPSPGEIEEVVVDLEFGRGLTLSGRALLHGEPLVGAHVSLRGRDVAARRSVTTDHQGGFRIEDVLAGRYWAQVSSGRELVSHSAELDLFQDQSLEIEIASSRVSGLVLDAASAEPLNEARITMRRLADSDPSQTVFLLSVVAEAGGAFLFPRVSPGTYRLSVEVDGFASVRDVLSVRGGYDIDDLRLFLHPTEGLALDVRVGTGNKPPYVSAGVLDAAGRVVVAETRNVDSDGRARFPTVPAGTWDLLVKAPGGATTRVRAQVPGEPIVLDIPQASRLTVRVEELLSSHLVAQLTLHDPEGRAFRNLGPYLAVESQWPMTGGRVIFDNLPADVWRLRVETSDGRSWNGQVETLPGIGTEIWLTSESAPHRPGA